MPREVEESGQVLGRVVVVSRVGEPSSRIPQFVEEGMAHGFNGRQPLGRSVFQEGRDEVNGLWGCLAEDLGWVSIDCSLPRQRACDRGKETGQSWTYLIEGMGLDLRELVLHVIGVHGANLLPSRGAEHLDDFHQLVNARFPREEGLAQHQFSHHTPS